MILLMAGFVLLGAALALSALMIGGRGYLNAFRLGQHSALKPAAKRVPDYLQVADALVKAIEEGHPVVESIGGARLNCEPMPIRHAERGDWVA